MFQEIFECPRCLKANYVVYLDDVTYYAKAIDPHGTDYSGTDAVTVIEDFVDNAQDKT